MKKNLKSWEVCRLSSIISKVRRSTKFCFVAPWKLSKFSARSLLEIVSCGKFDFSRLDLDGNSRNA